MLAAHGRLVEHGAAEGLVATGRLWTRPELMLAVELYCRTPFGRIHTGNPDIVALAKALDRTPGSIGLKMVNFAALDETIEQQGMPNVSKLDREIWSEFFSAPAEFLDRVESVRSQDYAIAEPAESGFELREGVDVLYTAKGRRNQDFFRQAVLAAYDNRCAVTGITQSDLLVASHIIPWKTDPNQRVRPTNGLCLNALHDRAFDRYLISFENDGAMILSKRLKMTVENRPFFEGRQLAPPRRFKPDVACLSHHRDAMLAKDKAA